MTTTPKEEIETPKPKFLVGQIVASDLYVGTIQSAFFVEGEWNYHIGENAGIEFDPNGGYRRGFKYIRESSVKWKQSSLMGEWVKV